MIYPITLGKGKRLFADGAIPAAFTVSEAIVTPCGALVMSYARAGALVMSYARAGALATGSL